MFLLHPKLYISAQVTPADLAQAAALGIDTVICHRPDHEETDQPTFATVAAWAQSANIHHVVHQATTMPTIDHAAAVCFADTVAAASTPVLAYCRTGTRSTLLWALDTVAKGSSVETVIRQAAAAGIDLHDQRSKLEAIA